MTESIGIVILAAGKGTRLKQKTPKPLLKIGGKTLLDYIILASEKFISNKSLKSQISIVVGHQKEEVIASLGDKKYNFPVQEIQNGTGGALQAYFKSVKDAWSFDYTMVLCSDTPLITSSELEKLFEALKAGKDAVAATFKLSDPSGLGRIIRENKGFKIIEEKDTNDNQKKVKEVNSAVYVIKNSYLKKHLDSLNTNNASGEFYLTDIFKTEENVEAVLFENADTFLGINTMNQLEEITGKLNAKKNNELMEDGVHLISSQNTYIDAKASIGSGTLIYPNVHIWGNTKIGSNVVIEPNCIIQDCEIKDNVTIKANSVLESSKVLEGASIGPFARLRPGTEIGSEAKIGNFVEVKKSKLASGVKVSHLSYIGDAEIGADSNIGCGFITCNYDGANKHVTKIGSGTFIGSDCQAIAPVEIGSNSFVAAGSTITNNIPDGGFAIARSKQTTKPEMAKKFLKKK